MKLAVLHIQARSVGKKWTQLTTKAEGLTAEVLAISRTQPSSDDHVPQGTQQQYRVYRQKRSGNAVRCWVALFSKGDLAHQEFQIRICTVDIQLCALTYSESLRR